MTPWRRHLTAYVSAVAIVGLPIAVAGIQAYLGVGGVGGIAAALTTVPLTVFALIAAVSLPFLPVLIWTAARSVNVRIAATLSAVVYAIVLYEGVRAAALFIDFPIAREFVKRWEEATLGQLIIVLPPVCAVFFVLEAILKFESRSSQW